MVLKLTSLGALCTLLLGAAIARAGEDPSELEPPPEPAPAAEPSDAPPAEATPPPNPDEPLPAEAPAAELAPADTASAHADDPLAICRALVLDDRLEDAERCAERVLEHAGSAAELAARAGALRDAIAAWRRSPGPAAVAPSEGPEATSPAVREQVKVSELVDGVSAEAMVHGALGGAGTGFLVAATVAATTRASEKDTLGWLIAAPVLGGVTGAAGGWGLARALRPEVGDLRLATSTMWMGATQGFLLQWAVFDQSPDVGAVPLRFLTMLGGGALGLGAGAALAPLLEVEDGDVAVAHSAALWGGVLTSITLAGVSSMIGAAPFPVLLAIVAGGIGVPYLGALACHSLLDLERWPSFLIDGGGAAGLLIAGSFLTVTAGVLQPSGPLVAGGLVLGAAAGLAVGATAAWMVSSAVRTETRARAGADEEGVE